MPWERYFPLRRKMQTDRTTREASHIRTIRHKSFDNLSGRRERRQDRLGRSRWCGRLSATRRRRRELEPVANVLFLFRTAPRDAGLRMPGDVDLLGMLLAGVRRRRRAAAPVAVGEAVVACFRELGCSFVRCSSLGGSLLVPGSPTASDAALGWCEGAVIRWHGGHCWHGRARTSAGRLGHCCGTDGCGVFWGRRHFF
jgi:hypothetical protein